MFLRGVDALRYLNANGIPETRVRSLYGRSVDSHYRVGDWEWPYPGKTTRWPISARARGRERRARLSRGICLRDMLVRKTLKGTRWKQAGESMQSVCIYYDRMTEREKERIAMREKAREREYWPRQAVSGLPIFRTLLVDPYEANYTSPRQRHPTYIRAQHFPSSLEAAIGSAARTSYIRYRCKSDIYLVRYSTCDNYIHL